jgi:hypothetical protein
MAAQILQRARERKLEARTVAQRPTLMHERASISRWLVRRPYVSQDTMAVSWFTPGAAYCAETKAELKRHSRESLRYPRTR